MLLIFSSCCAELFGALQIRPNNPEVKGKVYAFLCSALLYVFLACNAAVRSTGLHFGLPDFAKDSFPKLSADGSALW